MNAREAASFLRGKIPEGRGGKIASFSEGEFNWLQRNKPDWFGSGRKNKKSQLRSFQSPHEENVDKNVFGNVISPGVQEAQHATVRQAGAPPVVPQGAPQIASQPKTHPGGINPALIRGGHDTRVPQGPGSVTNPNDPYGVHEQIAGGVKDLIGQEYQGPELTPEERIAQASAETLQGRDLVQGMVGTGQTAYGEAAGTGKDVSGYDYEKVGSQDFLSGKGVDQYMSPHTDAVIGGMQKQAMDTMKKQRGSLQAQHQMAGAGLGSRGALENAAMMGQVQQGLGRQVAGALESSYAQAAGMKESDMKRAQDAALANQRAGLAGQDVRLRGAETQISGTDAGRGAAAQDIGLVSQVGADVEGREQNVLDETMGDFYEERDWDKNQLATASNIYGTLPSGQTTTTTGAPQHRKKDKFGRVISGAATGWLASGGNPWGAAVGGGAALLS